MKGKRITALMMLLLLAGAALSASSFGIGVEGSYNYTFVNTRTRFEGYSYGSFHGFDVAVPVEYRILPWLSVDSGVRYIMKSESFRNVNTTTGTVISDYVMMHHFIEFPLTIRFSCTLGRARLFLGGGGYVGVRVGEVHYGKSLDVNTEVLKSYSEVIALTTSDNRFDAGLIAEGGIGYGFDSGELYLAVRYQYGLTSLAARQRNAVNTYLDNLSAGIGFMFSL